MAGKGFPLCHRDPSPLLSPQGLPTASLNRQLRPPSEHPGQQHGHRRLVALTHTPSSFLSRGQAATALLLRTGRPLSGFPANPALALPGTSALPPKSISEALSGRLPCVQKSSVPLLSPAHPGAQPGSCWSLLPRGSPGPPGASCQGLGPQPPPPRGCPAHSHSRGPGETGSFPASRAGQAQRRGDSAQGTLADTPAQREHIWGWLSDTPTSGPDEAV